MRGFGDMTRSPEDEAPSEHERRAIGIVPKAGKYKRVPQTGQQVE